MKVQTKFIIVGALALAVIAAVALKQANRRPEPDAGASQPAPASEAAGGTVDAAPAPAATTKLPKLLDLGADKCIPCRMMAPILEELKKEYAGRLEVEFIDVWKNPEAGRRYGIQMIPTQIFYDADGKELFRHVGFISKEDILAKWKELGITLGEKPESGASSRPATSEPLKAE